MNASVKWRQTHLHKADVAKFLTVKGLHPGYFHIIESTPHRVYLVYLVLPRASEV